MASPLSPTARASTHATAVTLRGRLLKESDYRPPSREELLPILDAVLTMTAPRLRPRADQIEVERAIVILAQFRDGQIRSSGEMGRRLKPGCRSDYACAVGRKRLTHLVSVGWAERTEIGWAITESGRAEAARLALGHPAGRANL